MNQKIATVPVDTEVNRQARERALGAVSWPLNLVAATVGYQSHGHLLAIGDSAPLLEVLERARGLEQGLASITLVVTDVPDDALLQRAEAADVQLQPLLASQLGRLHLEGYLGHFSAWLDGHEGPIELARALLGREHHDLVLDLTPTPRLPLELPPPGYFHAPVAGEARTTLIDGLGDYIGEFEKPRYFEVHADGCAHSTRGFVGCTRCLKVCPADAIKSVPGRIDARIEIDPYLCQGVGSCTSACPTGAIEFRQPHSLRQQDTLLAWLDHYHAAGGQSAVLRFVQADHAQHLQPDAAGHVIDVALEDLGSAGVDHWLSAIAAGACEVRIQAYSDMPDRLVAHLEDQLAQGRAILEALGHDPGRLQWFSDEEQESSLALPRHAGLTPRLRSLEQAQAFGSDKDTPSATVQMAGGRTGTTGATDGAEAPGKRERLTLVLDHLATTGHVDGERHPMPPGSPFGGIEVNADACTLCMGCVASCPTGALGAGGDTPRLDFREADCVQCGLCSKSCPESAIRLSPGFLASAERSQWRVCHEDAPFHCIVCGSAFANARTIAAIQQKLANHAYFSGDQARRLEMCQDCRVKDVWHEMATNPEAQLKL